MAIYLTVIFMACILLGSILDHLALAKPLEGKYVTRVKNGKHSYVVSIAYINNSVPTEETHICTGVLIKNKFVLTAAHCFEGYFLGEIRLIVGSVDLREGKKYYPSMWITYNQWADSKNITKSYAVNDVAIVKLSDKVSNQIAKTASISFKKHDSLLGEYTVLVAWGETIESPAKAPRYLQEVKVKVLSNKICENIVSYPLRYKVFIPDKYLCTKGEPHALLTLGDSGGPVLRKNSVVAISSLICPEIDLCDLPDDVVYDHTINLHTTIDLYKEFITDVLKNY